MAKIPIIAFFLTSEARLLNPIAAEAATGADVTLSSVLLTAVGDDDVDVAITGAAEGAVIGPEDGAGEGALDGAADGAYCSGKREHISSVNSSHEKRSKIKIPSHVTGAPTSATTFPSA